MSPDPKSAAGHRRRLSSSLLYPSYRQHVMLLYRDDAERTGAIASYIDEGLKGGQLCVYASGRSADMQHLESLSSRVPSFAESLRKGSLTIIDFKPFHESALRGDLSPFVQLKGRLERMLQEYASAGKGDRMLIVADAADNLSAGGHLDQCETLESWWDETHAGWTAGNRNITVICPHSGPALQGSPQDKIGSCHSLTIDLQQRTRPMRILVAEPEPDLQTVYRRYLDLLGMEAVVAPNGTKCLESAFDVSGRGFDMIVLDTRLDDIGSEEVAARIRARTHNQRIVFTTTSELELESLGARNEDVLIKPFKFSHLLSLARR